MRAPWPPRVRRNRLPPHSIITRGGDSGPGRAVVCHQPSSIASSKYSSKLRAMPGSFQVGLFQRSRNPQCQYQKKNEGAMPPKRRAPMFRHVSIVASSSLSVGSAALRAPSIASRAPRTSSAPSMPARCLAIVVTWPSKRPTAQQFVPVPFLPQIPVRRRRGSLVRGKRSEWLALQPPIPITIVVRREAALRASVRIVSGCTPVVACVCSGRYSASSMARRRTMSGRTSTVVPSARVTVVVPSRRGAKSSRSCERLASRGPRSGCQW